MIVSRTFCSKIGRGRGLTCSVTKNVSGKKCLEEKEHTMKSSPFLQHLLALKSSMFESALALHFEFA